LDAPLDATMTDLLSVDVDLDGVADPGDQISYTVVVDNPSVDTAQDFVLDVDMSAGSSLVAGSAATTLGIIEIGNAAGDASVRVAAALPASSSATITFHVVVDADAGDLSNQGVLTVGGTVTVLTDDPSAPGLADPTVTHVQSLADLAIITAAALTAPAGDHLAYDVTVTSNGPGPARDVSVLASTPADTTFVSFTQAAGPPTSVTTPAVGDTGPMSASLDSLPVGESLTFVIVVALDPALTVGTLIGNSVTVAGTSTDPNPGNNAGTANTSVVERTADLALAKSLIGTLMAGSTATYALQVTNTGPHTATSTITVTDVLPTGLDFRGAAGPGWDCAHASGTITCTTSGDLPSGTSSTVTIDVDVALGASGTITNVAQLAGGDLDPTPDDRTASAATAVSPATTSSGSASTTTTVLAAATTTAPVQPPLGGVLPETGSGTSATTSAAMLLVLVGLTMISIAARRRSRSST
jgi:uncharacterized repeat protein (TIGR01451 family)